MSKETLLMAKKTDPAKLQKISVAGMGWLGTTDYLPQERILWKNMLYRVKDHPAYKDVTVCDRWLCLGYFIEDLRSMDNYDKWLENTSGYHLDKDLKYAGNKVYSKQFCSLVPAEKNQKVTKNRKFGHYVAQHDDGTVVEFKNQRAFARDYGLCYKNLGRSIKKGGRTKGWRIVEVITDAT